MYQTLTLTRRMSTADCIRLMRRQGTGMILLQTRKAWNRHTAGSSIFLSKGM